MCECRGFRKRPDDTLQPDDLLLDVEGILGVAHEFEKPLGSCVVGDKIDQRKEYIARGICQESRRASQEAGTSCRDRCRHKEANEVCDQIDRLSEIAGHRSKGYSVASVTKHGCSEWNDLHATSRQPGDHEAANYTVNYQAQKPESWLRKLCGLDRESGFLTARDHGQGSKSQEQVPRLNIGSANQNGSGRSEQCNRYESRESRAMSEVRTNQADQDRQQTDWLDTHGAISDFAEVGSPPRAIRAYRLPCVGSRPGALRKQPESVQRPALSWTN